MQRSERIVTSVPSFSGVWEVEEKEEAKGESADIPVSLSAPNALRMRLRDWLILIPDYDGCPERLERFAYAVRYVAEQVGAAAERTLLLALGVKLRSRARAYLEHRLHRHSSIEEFLSCLGSRFSELGNEALLLDELRCARQQSHESVGEYGARIDRLAARLCAIYEQDWDVEKREPNKKLVEDVALGAFRRGLRDPELELSLAACEVKTLEEAIGTALALDNRFRSRGKIVRQYRPRQSSYNFTCKRKRR